jgi:hypothetical protein
LLKIVVTYAFLQFGDEALKDAYKVAKQSLIERLEAFGAEKNQGREPCHRIQFSAAEDGQLFIVDPQD